jgi:predicted enzyme related to lactoylglutathione lyase
MSTDSVSLLTECCQEDCAIVGGLQLTGAIDMANVTPDNAIVWFEIPVSDIKRSKAFYDAVLKSKLEDDNTGPNPMAIFSIKDMKAGIAGHLYPGKPAKSGTGNTVHLLAPEPLEDSLERLKKAGGKVVSDIVKIPPGRFAYCEDLDGNSIGLFTRN